MSLLAWARGLTLSCLALIGLTATLAAWPSEWTMALAAANLLLAAAYGWALHRSRQNEFSLAAGTSLVINVSALALLSGLGMAGVWAAFGLGLMALMAGNHTCRSAQVLSLRRPGDAEGHRAFASAARRGYLRIVLFVGMVMIVSLFLLMIVLNAQLGQMPSWAFAALALAAMVAFAALARSRHAEG